MATKKCFKCHEVKPLGDFYKHKGMADGHLNKCKECTKRDVTEHRWKNVERVREYDRQRGRTEKRRAKVRERVDHLREHEPDVLKRRNAERLRKFRAAYPLKVTAHRKVRNAVRTGRLVPQPCDRCGSEPTEGHHEDYSKPLDVIWLCVRCHSDRHLEINEARRAARRKAAKE